MPEASALRVRPGARMTTPLCRLAQEVAALTGWRRYGAAFLLGALLAGALPPVDLTPLIFAVFPLLLWLDDGSRGPWASARLGYVFGLGYFTVGMYWVAAALFVDIAAFWWALPFAVLGIPAVLAVSTALTLSLTAVAASRLGWTGAARICVFAVSWTAFEWLRGHILSGLPWNLIGYVWAGGFPGVLAMLQTTAWVGIYGLSFLTVAAASAPALIGEPSLAPLTLSRRLLPALVTALLLLVPAAAGAVRLTLLGPADTGIWLRLVQPSIAESLKWDPLATESNFHRLVELSGAPAPHSLAAVIWPEAAATFLLERDDQHRAAIGIVAPASGYAIAGALHGSPPPGPPTQIWNSIDAIDPSGHIVAQYDKVHLVPFGEYMPLRSLLPFKKLTAGTIDLSAGPGPRTITLPRLPPFAPLICYEAIFPATLIDPRERPAWLLNVTNDAWYGRSSGPYQHFAIARTRAVEEGLPLVRVANNGISGVVDAEGRVLAHTSLDAVGYADIVLPAAGAPTLYSRAGDWILLVVLLVGAVAAVALAPQSPSDRSAG
jgi:apolipoprotein N-acyltransferase